MATRPRERQRPDRTGRVSHVPARGFHRLYRRLLPIWLQFALAEVDQVTGMLLYVLTRFLDACFCHPFCAQDGTWVV